MATAVTENRGRAQPATWLARESAALAPAVPCGARKCAWTPWTFAAANSTDSWVSRTLGRSSTHSIGCGVVNELTFGSVSSPSAHFQSAPTGTTELGSSGGVVADAVAEAVGDGLVVVVVRVAGRTWSLSVRSTWAKPTAPTTTAAAAPAAVQVSIR